MPHEIPVAYSWELTPADDQHWLFRLYGQDGQELGRVLLTPHLADCLAEGCSHPPPHAKPRPDDRPTEYPRLSAARTVWPVDGDSSPTTGGEQ